MEEGGREGERENSNKWYYVIKAQKESHSPRTARALTGGSREKGIWYWLLKRGLDLGRRRKMEYLEETVAQGKASSPIRLELSVHDRKGREEQARRVD